MDSALSAYVIYFADDLPYMNATHPYFGGDCSIRAKKVALEKMAIIDTFGPVLTNGRCICYMLDDHR